MSFRALARLAPCLGALWLGALPALRAEPPFAFARTPGQLPKTAIPRHYTLHIQPDLTARTTTGTARIELDVLSATPELVLNALELEITAATLVDDPATPQPLTARMDPARQTLVLARPGGWPAGQHTITISYRGKIGTQAEGFFVDKYPTPTGDKLLLGTQVEPTAARRVVSESACAGARAPAPCSARAQRHRSCAVVTRSPAPLPAHGWRQSRYEPDTSHSLRPVAASRRVRANALPTPLDDMPQGANGGRPQWDWDGNRETPTLTPSINCEGHCGWHGHIRNGRCVTTAGVDEP